MQKYKKGQDQCGQLSKPTKPHAVTSVNSNKSLLKLSTNTQNKSTTSVLNPHEHSNAYPLNPNTKSLNQKNKSSKHLQSHTFATNTHQNSINIVIPSTSHNNSKSNKKGSNQNKKSNGKKGKEKNDGKGMGEYGRTMSQYENLSFGGKDKGEMAKNYKNVLKARKQQKQINYFLINSNKQAKELVSNPANKPRQQQIKTTSQLTKKSINISSLKQLKSVQSKSRSRSKEFQKMSKKSQNSKKHLLTEISQTVTTKENNINIGNSKSVTKRDNKNNWKVNDGRIAGKKRNISSASHLFSNHLIMNNQNKQKSRPKHFPLEQYQRVPMHIFKSSTNSDIQYSNIDQNTVKSIINKKRISNQPYFCNQDDESEIVFCSDDEGEGEDFHHHRAQKDSGRDFNQNGRKYDHKNERKYDHKNDNLSKRYSRMNLELSSQCFNCLTEPDYLIQPKGIRNLHTVYPNTQQSLKSSNPKSSSSSKPIHQQSHKSLLHNHRKAQLERKSAIKIQKVWRGYMTRKLLAMFICEEEMKLERRMREFGMGKIVHGKGEIGKTNNQAYLIDGKSYVEEEEQSSAPNHHFTSNQLDQSQIHSNPCYQQRFSIPPEINPNQLQLQINNSLNTLDYESQILPREEQETISFLGEINNIGLRGYSLIENDLAEEENGVMYTSVESVEGKVRWEGEAEGGPEGESESESESEGRVKWEVEGEVDQKVNEEFGEEEDQFGDQLVMDIGKNFEIQEKNASYQEPFQQSYQNNESYPNNESYQIDNTQLFQKEEQSHIFQEQSSYKDPTTILNPPHTYTKQSDSYLINESSIIESNKDKISQKIDESKQNERYGTQDHRRDESSYRIGDEEIDGQKKGQSFEEENDDGSDEMYEDDSLELPQQPSVIIQNSLKQYHYKPQNPHQHSFASHQQQYHPTDQSYIPDHDYLHDQHSSFKNFSKSYDEQFSNELDYGKNEEAIHFYGGEQIKKEQIRIEVKEESFRLEDHYDEKAQNNQLQQVEVGEKNYEEKSDFCFNQQTGQTEEIKSQYRIKKHTKQSSDIQETEQKDHIIRGPNDSIQAKTKPAYTSKSNPNILIVKSPKHQQFIKSYFAFDKEDQNQLINSANKTPAQREPLQKTSSLKQIFMKKSFFNQKNLLLPLDNEVNLPMPYLPSMNLAPYPTEKQASSIQQLLHFRHQCLTQQHSQQFHLIQQQYIEQKITKQQFIKKLNQLAEHFQQSTHSIKQTQKDIFNGYKALLKLIKDVVKDCKILGFGQDKGSNVRFCRSMELFGGEKSLLNGRECVLGHDFMWRFDRVMIDEIEGSRNRGKVVGGKEQREEKGQEGKQNKGKDIEEKEKSIQLPHESLEQSITSNSSSIFSTTNAQPNHIPLPIPSQEKSSSSSQQKQLSRQSSSHHHLPQLILSPKPQSPDKMLSISRKVLGFKETNGVMSLCEDETKKKEMGQDVDQLKCQENDEKIYQPCSFDISELGECEDEYVDDDEEEMGDEVKDMKGESSKNSNLIRIEMRKPTEENQDNKELTEQPWSLNQSSSYNIDDEPFEESSNNLLNEQKSLESSQHRSDDIMSLRDHQSPHTDEQGQSYSSESVGYNIAHCQLTEKAEHYSEPATMIISGFSSIIGQTNKLSRIDKKNQQLSQLSLQDANDQDLLNQRTQQELNEVQRTEQQFNSEQLSSSESDNLQPQPFIKRQVYQLSCDSDDDEEQLKAESPIGKIISKGEHVFRRMESYDCSIGQLNNHHQLTNLSAKYNQLAKFIAQLLLWQFIEEITLNKARNTAKSSNSMGKRISDSAKFTFQLVSSEPPFYPDALVEDQSNIIIITNSSSRQKRPKHKISEKLRNDSKQKGVMGRIREQEIRQFLELLYKQMPKYEQSKSKLIQRMYPNPLQLLKSLRDTEMQNHFKDNLVSSSESRQEQNDELHNKVSSMQQQSHSPSSQHVDSQTSYLELGSYEFILSQQLCEFIIEKYIVEVYELRCEIKQKDGSEERGLQQIKREFNQYIGVRNMLEPSKVSNKNYRYESSSPEKQQKPPKPNEFQTIVRTRQLFYEHKQLQSQMLRKQIMKIQLHTILDSLNQQLIKERESKTGYSGIGLNELALGLIERKGIQVCSEQDYNILVSKAKYRLEKFVLNNEVDVNDKLIIQCQESVTINDSQWVFYVTEALEFGLEIAKIVEEMVWQETVREITRMMVKRKFKMQDDTWKMRQDNGWKKSMGDNQSEKREEVNYQTKFNNEGVEKKDLFRPRKVVSINIVVPGEEQGEDEKAKKEQQKSQEEWQISHKYYHPHDEQISPTNQQPFTTSNKQSDKYDDIDNKQEIDQKITISHKQASDFQSESNQFNDQNDNSYQLDDEEIDFNEDEQLERELENMNCQEDEFRKDSEAEEDGN